MIPDFLHRLRPTIITLLFDLILQNGRDRAESFLVKDPTDWESDPVYIEKQQKVQQMKVVSDCALITS